MLRLPLQALATCTAGSTSGSVVFQLPTNDFSGLVAKLTARSFFATGDGLTLFVQTTDDGGTTWYDCGRFATVRATVSTADAKFLSLPVDIGDGAYFANATDMSIAVGSVGLPVLSNYMKLKWTVTGSGSTTTANWTATIYANSTSRT